MSDSRSAERTTALVAPYRAACFALAAAHGVQCLDTWDLFLGPGFDVNDIPALEQRLDPILEDGVHFGAAGNSALFEGLVRLIKREGPELDHETMPQPVEFWNLVDPARADETIFAHARRD
nr:hypothetical protein HK105_006850 [Polyrhizophydium stewartii]